MANRKRPWIRIDVGFTTHPKLVALSSDRARWGWLHILEQGKVQVPFGVFASVRHLRAVAGQYARYVDEYQRVGLLDQALPGGSIGIHDWPQYQWTAEPNFRDPSLPPSPAAERTRAWRLRNTIFTRDQFACRYCGTSDYPRELLIVEHVIPVGRPDSTNDEGNLVTACRPCNLKKGGRTPEEAGMALLPAPEGDDVTHHRDASPRRVRDAIETPYSRARGVTMTDDSLSSDRESSKRARGNGNPSPLELAVDDALMPRAATPKQYQAMRDLASQLSESTVIAVLRRAIGTDDAYGSALHELKAQAKTPRRKYAPKPGAFDAILVRDEEPADV